MTYRVRNIGIAVALAVLAAVMISYYVTSYKRHVQHGASDVTVLVATKDIPAGTSGVEVAKQHLLRSISVNRTAVVPGAISNGSENFARSRMAVTMVSLRSWVWTSFG